MNEKQLTNNVKLRGGVMAQKRGHEAVRAHTLHTVHTHVFAVMWRLLITHILNGQVSLPRHVNMPAVGFILT